MICITKLHVFKFTDTFIGQTVEKIVKPTKWTGCGCLKYNRLEFIVTKLYQTSYHDNKCITIKDERYSKCPPLSGFIVLRGKKSIGK